jgi:hypothetical protein
MGAMKIADSKIVRICEQCGEFFLDQNLDNWKLDYAMHESLDAMIADAEAQSKVGEI